MPISNNLAIFESPKTVRRPDVELTAPPDQERGAVTSSVGAFVGRDEESSHRPSGGPGEAGIHATKWPPPAQGSIGTTEPTAGPSTAALAIKLREPPLRMTLFI
jgi:hypothetical protein